MVRCKGRCENCGKATRRLEWAHAFGRRQTIGEPWCSSPELTFALCAFDPLDNTVGCHRLFDAYLDPRMVTRLKETAARRFYEKHKARYPKSLDPVGAIRKLVSKLEKEQGKPLPPTSPRRHDWKFSTQGDDPLQRPLYDRGTR